MRNNRVRDIQQQPATGGVRTTGRRLGSAAIAIGLTATGLAACSDSTADDPLPLSEDDSGVIVEESPVEEAPVEEAPVEEAPAEDEMEEGEG